MAFWHCTVVSRYKSEVCLTRRDETRRDKTWLGVIDFSLFFLFQKPLMVSPVTKHPSTISIAWPNLNIDRRRRRPPPPQQNKFSLSSLQLRRTIRHRWHQPRAILSPTQPQPKPPQPPLPPMSTKWNGPIEIILPVHTRMRIYWYRNENPWIYPNEVYNTL